MLNFEFIGHFHPLLVHLPIGIILFSFALMLYERYAKTDFKAVIQFSFLMGAIAAIFACVTGYLLSRSGEYDLDLISKHQWTGISTAVVGVAICIFKKYRWFLAVLLFVVLTFTGHYGASITHGENYLFSSQQSTDNDTIAPTQSRTSLNSVDKVDKKITASKKVSVYQQEIYPILKAKCYNCHSSIKLKGGLRLDAEAFIMKGGREGKVLLAGQAENSPMYTHLRLPMEDEKHMPPKGKNQLLEIEIDRIFRWIKNGASFKEEEVMVVSNQDDLQINNLNTIENKSSKQSIEKNYKQKEVALISINQDNKNEIVGLIKVFNPIAPEILENFKAQNLNVSFLQEGSNGVSVNFINVKKYTHQLLFQLNKIEEQIVNLKLSNQPVMDDDLNSILDCMNLKVLSLENTAITDHSMALLSQLKSLEQLNLYGTNITDEGIKELIKFKKIKVVYLWNTKVTSKGLDRIRQQMPQVKMEIGNLKWTKKDTAYLKS